MERVKILFKTPNFCLKGHTSATWDTLEFPGFPNKIVNGSVASYSSLLQLLATQSGALNCVHRFINRYTTSSILLCDLFACSLWHSPHFLAPSRCNPFLWDGVGFMITVKLFCFFGKAVVDKLFQLTQFYIIWKVSIAIYLKHPQSNLEV